jgi:hypothetical protein
MNPSPTDTAADEPIPEPEMQRGKRFSIIWLIPLLAALIGAWLAVKTIRETGPTITIVFRSAEGLVPGKTEIKYKDVTVGKVQRIQLSEDLEQVLVTARHEPGSRRASDTGYPVLDCPRTGGLGRGIRYRYPAVGRLYRHDARQQRQGHASV